MKHMRLQNHAYPVVFGLSLQNVFSKKLLSGDTYKFR